MNGYQLCSGPVARDQSEVSDKSERHYTRLVSKLHQVEAIFWHYFGAGTKSASRIHQAASVLETHRLASFAYAPCGAGMGCSGAI